MRTAIGGFCGAFEYTPAPTLGSVVAKAAVARSGVPADQIDEVIFGNVVSAGLGQNVARQVGNRRGLSPAVGAMTVNKVCGSGPQSGHAGRPEPSNAGMPRLIVAGGAENMSRAPYLLEKARSGYRMGNGELIDSMIRDGLWDVYKNVHMGICGDRCAEKYSFTRQHRTILQSRVSSVPSKPPERVVSPEEIEPSR